MILAAHFTEVLGGLKAKTVETVRFERPERISFRLVRGPVPHVIEVPVDVAAGFACNAIAVGHRVVSSLAAERLEGPLHDAGFDTVVALPMSEFMKSGGGVRCLSLPLDTGRAAA